MNKKIVSGVLLSGLWSSSILAAEEAASVESPMTQRMMILAFQVGIILIAAKIGHIIFEKFHLPGVLGELCSGFVIGPYAFGAVPLPGFTEGFFPPGQDFPVSVELYGLCSIAAIVLLFITGLETDFKMLARFSFVGSMVALGGVVASFALGIGCTYYFSDWILHRPIGLLSPTALFMGIVSTATSVGITARLLSENRKLDTPEGVTTLAGAVVDDVMGVIILAMVMAYVSASRSSGIVDWGHVRLIAIKAVSVWLGFTALGLWLSRSLSTFLKMLRNRYTITMFSLGLSLLVAAFFESSGLAMIIGAYVMGLSLSNTDIVNILTDKLESVYEFLVPIFFCVVGMFVDFRVFRSRETVIFGIIFTVLAILAKVVGCGLPALILKFNAIGALRIGIGMIPRGEVALIMASIALTERILNSEMMGVVIMMTMFSTLMAPPALVGLLKIERAGFKKEGKSFELPELVFPFPSADVAKELVFRLADVFKADGFIAHFLEKTNHIQMRRNGTVIGLRREEDRLIFTCNENDFTYINTAVIEVAAKLEHIAQALRKPMHLERFVSLTPDRSPDQLRMDISRYMSPNRIIPRLKAFTKDEVINELLAKLKNTSHITDCKAVHRAVWLRERDMSTGMTNGIALPHGHSDAVDDLMCVVGLSPEGVDFDSLDKKPARIFILSVSPEHKPTPHTEFMSNICIAFDEVHRNQILSLQTADEIFNFFKLLHQAKENNRQPSTFRRLIADHR